jgi:predicted transcriptional regulator YheO
LAVVRNLTGKAVARLCLNLKIASIFIFRLREMRKVAHAELQEMLVIAANQIK